MTAMTSESSAIERYLEAVRAELADLGDDERVDMLEDVEQHLLEVAAEGDEPLETRLGPPVEYAAELRAAAGLPPKASDEEPPALSLAGRATRQLATLRDRVMGVPGSRETAAFLTSLRPGWWVLRAYFVVLALGVVASEYPHRPSAIPRLWDSVLAGLIALGLLVWASVAWSRAAESRRGLAALTIIGNVAVLVALLLVAGHERSMRARYDPYDVRNHVAMAWPVGLASDGRPVTNIYPYAADGTPLDGVLLYDQDGQPIRLQERPQPAAEYGYPVPPRVTESRDGFPYDEPIFDPNTGERIGTRQRPVVIVPSATSGVLPSASATPGTHASPTP